MKTKMFLLLVLFPFLIWAQTGTLKFSGMSIGATAQTGFTQADATNQIWKMELNGKTYKYLYFFDNLAYNDGWYNLDVWAGAHDAGSITDSLTITAFPITYAGLKIMNDSTILCTNLDFVETTYDSVGYRYNINFDGWSPGAMIKLYYNAADTDTINVWLQLR